MLMEVAQEPPLDRTRGNDLFHCLLFIITLLCMGGMGRHL